MEVVKGEVVWKEWVVMNGVVEVVVGEGDKACRSL